MRILLVQSYTRHATPIFPIGLAHIAAVLRAEHEIQGLDPNLCENPWDSLAERLQDSKPDAVGISLRNVDDCTYTSQQSFYGDFTKIIRIVKEACPGAKVVVGGSGFSIYAKYILAREKDIDVGVFLEGEETALELFRRLDDPRGVKGCFVREGQDYTFQGPRPFADLVKVPRPDYDLFDPAQYHFPMSGIGIQSKRGCGHGCAYCPYPFLNGTALRLRSAREVVDDIETIYEKHHVCDFSFVDSVFNSPLSHAMEICQEIIRRGLRIHWSAYTTLTEFTEEYARLAMASGCVAFTFSADAFSDRSLRALQKPTSVQDIVAAVEIAKKVRETAMEFDFFVDPPESRMGDLVRMSVFLLKTKLALKGRLRRMFRLNRIRIEPHTAIFDLAVRQGLIRQDQDLLAPLFYSEPAMRLITHPMDAAFRAMRPLLLFKRRIQRMRQGGRNSLGIRDAARGRGQEDQP